VNSDGDWGGLATDEQREAWDRFGRIPEPGHDQALDAFLDSKHLDHSALVRIGARMSGPATLAFAYEGGIKYRNVVTGEKYGFMGSTFPKLKIVPGTDRARVLICEGETDGMRLTMLYDCDVAIMPAGARNWQATYTEQVEHYEAVYVCLDADEAGDDGYTKIVTHLPHAVRHRPPEVNDWCELEGDPPPLPEPPERQAPLPILVSARELLAMEVPEVISWFDQAVLPVGGTMVLHATFKSFKTWMSLDLASALAQARPWATFPYTADRPARVAYLNFEVPFPYYVQRVNVFYENAAEPDLFMDNFFTAEPLTRPHLTTGVTASEDRVIEYVTQYNIDVVFIDPIRRAMGYASLNDEHDVRRPLHFAERLNRLGVTVVLLHHDNKEADVRLGGDPAGMTGSAAWAGDVDTIVSVWRTRQMKREDPKRNLHFLMRNDSSIVPDKGFLLNETGSVVWQGESWVEDVDPANHEQIKDVDV
jgi:5S rRNA maturation endonuclease (ribonuclease M5)